MQSTELRKISASPRRVIPPKIFPSGRFLEDALALLVAMYTPARSTFAAYKFLYVMQALRLKQTKPEPIKRGRDFEAIKPSVWAYGREHCLAQDGPNEIGLTMGSSLREDTLQMSASRLHTTASMSGEGLQSAALR